MDLESGRFIEAVKRALHIPSKPSRVDWSKPIYGYIALAVAVIILGIAAVTQ
jgi:hypothetical protein